MLYRCRAISLQTCKDWWIFSYQLGNWVTIFVSCLRAQSNSKKSFGELIFSDSCSPFARQQGSFCYHSKPLILSSGEGSFFTFCVLIFLLKHMLLARSSLRILNLNGSLVWPSTSILVFMQESLYSFSGS